MEFQRGNRKLGKDTIIFNMGPAKNCPSKSLGLCQLKNCKDCYAMKAERQYPQVLPYRERQAIAWKSSIMEFFNGMEKFKNNKAIKYVRFNEAGDFYNQNCISKLSIIAKTYPQFIFYGYTARKDLSFKNLPKNLVITGSNWKRGKMNKFKVVDKPSGKNPVCPGNCRLCDLCKESKSLTIEAIKH